MGDLKKREQVDLPPNRPPTAIAPSPITVFLYFYRSDEKEYVSTWKVRFSGFDGKIGCEGGF